MSIAALRGRSYPGSDILIEEELEPRSGYRRYYASYLSDGLRIYGLLTEPEGEPPPGGWPALVLNHGYILPEVYSTTESYAPHVDAASRHGYVVFLIDYRGHDRSEGDALGAYADPGYTVDVLNGIASLRRFPIVDPDRIGMWGHSMGGYMTLRAMVISPDIRCGVIWSGVVGSYQELTYEWPRPGPTPTPRPETPSPRTDWVAQHGSPEDNPEFWASVSATSYLSDLSGPLQLHHASPDDQVPVDWSIRLEQRAREAGKAAELFLYEGDNHNLSGNFSTAMTRTLDFYDRCLE
jgi:dipeptidyl aminopeptidase/acylaminoacyl peptidase